MKNLFKQLLAVGLLVGAGMGTVIAKSHKKDDYCKEECKTPRKCQDSLVGLWKVFIPEGSALQGTNEPVAFFQFNADGNSLAIIQGSSDTQTLLGVSLPSTAVLPGLWSSKKSHSPCGDPYKVCFVGFNPSGDELSATGSSHSNSVLKVRVEVEVAKDGCTFCGKAFVAVPNGGNGALTNGGSSSTKTVTVVPICGKRVDCKEKGICEKLY